MFSERSPWVGEIDQNPEDLQKERQKKKLTRFYAHDEDWNYIFGSNREGFRENELTSDEEKRAQKAIIGDKDIKEKERDLLKNMRGPVDWHGADMVFDGMASDKHQKRILGYMTGMEWGKHDYTSGRNVADFLQKYPTPIDFENEAEDFLGRIKNHPQNSEQKYQEYVEAMDEFQQKVYGKRYEYYKAMKELHKEAEGGGSTEELSRWEPAQEKLFYGEFFEKDPVIKDAGLATINKGDLTGNTSRINEDAAYYNPELGVFGVFDGAGGVRGAALASQIARDTMVREVDDRVPETPYELGQILAVANEAVTGVGVSTAVVGRILETRGRKALAWASVGDSRIYVVRKGAKEAIQITKDEGEGNMLWYGLGYGFRVRQAGEFPLENGDRVVFCSDGVTGDYAKDFILNDEFASIVGKAKTADMAAWSLINRATKRDDRTAIVAEV